MSFDPSFMNPNTDEQDIDRVFYLLHRYYEKNCRAVNETETFRSNEIDLAHLVVDFINKACFERDNAGDLTFGDDSPADVTVIDESSDTDADDYIPSQGETSNKKRMMEDFYNVETMHKIVEMAENHPFSAVQHRYRKIRDRSDIHRCKKYIEHPTSLLRKQLKVELYTKFCEWNGEGHVIQDRDLRYEAYQIAAALGLTNFKASDSYIKRFEKHHRIVSRKITRMVAIKAVDRLHLITDNVERFRTDARSILSNMDHDKVYNTDQSGIQMELRSGRTLTFMGVKQVEVTCQRENALTHSVTIQPAISASGTLQLPMLVCFGERNPPQCFDAQLQPYQNLKCCHSTSGNMSSILFEEWVRNVYLPAAGEGSVLIIDSWSGYAKAKETFEREIEFSTIPAKATSLVQPLDLFFNRQFKSFYRRLTELMLRQNPNFIVSQREHIAKLLNVTVSQFSAERFRPMLRFAWFSAGLLPNKPPRFEVPEKFCFEFRG
ncbi:hypothetical protein QR680_014981 [Steinernema hermaphroditum]|uniref:DDE-1 domain-containing protein n=1 Tax=Steinernema hermaphroditum TaxID=289476 RepID=A0AA39IDA1_9BILA|nr:hypothetical protein QR680_014981 [Steinernema hermaphroditum]